MACVAGARREGVLVRRPSAVLLAVGMLIAGCGSEQVPAIAGAAGPVVVDIVVTPHSGPGEPARPGQRYRLARDAQRLLDSLSELGELPDSESCNADAGDTLDLTVRRPGEQEARVRAEAFGCEVVTGWGEDRAGGKQVQRLVLELLERQRVASPIADPVPGPCPRPLRKQLSIQRPPVPRWDALAVLDQRVVGMPYQAVRARVCRYDALGEGSRPAVERVVPADVAERLRRLATGDLRAGVGFLCPLIVGAADVVVWVDGSGGSFEARIARGDCTEIITGSGRYVGGTAGAELQATLDSVLS